MVVCLHSIYFFASRNVEEDVFHHIGEIMRHMLDLSLVNSNWHWYFNQFLWAILCLILELKAWKSLPTCEGVEAASIFFMLWIQKLRTELRIENYRQIYSTACVYRSITQACDRLLANSASSLHAPACNEQERHACKCVMHVNYKKSVN